jgi:hypothetical protein
MTLLNISCRDTLKAKARSGFGEDKAELRPCGTPTRRAGCQFPENREISSAPCLDLCCNPSALRMNSLFSTEQGIRLAEQGIHLRKQGILQFCLAYLAIECRWLCFAKTR